MHPVDMTIYYGPKPPAAPAPKHSGTITVVTPEPRRVPTPVPQQVRYPTGDQINASLQGRVVLPQGQPMGGDITVITPQPTSKQPVVVVIANAQPMPDGTGHVVTRTRY
jgi:hypothetical protein